MGGCVSGQRDINDTHPNIFTVNNIDDEGNSLGNGHLEVGSYSRTRIRGSLYKWIKPSNGSKLLEPSWNWKKVPTVRKVER